MRKRLRAKLRFILLAAAALALCAPAWSDANVTGGSSNTRRVCYCDCETKAGSPACTHMCELAKYEKRPWATSCHKEAESEPDQPSNAPGTHSAKENNVQQARR